MPYGQEDSNFARIHSLRSKFVLRSTTAFCKAKTPNVAPVHRFAVSGSHDQASYKKQKSRCAASTFLFLAGAGGFGLVATPQSRCFDFGFATLLGQSRL